MPRYYVYSIEAGSSPHAPYHEDDDFDTCVMVCDALSETQDVNAYVVDRLDTAFPERYVRISTSFRKTYDATHDRIREISSNATSIQ